MTRTDAPASTSWEELRAAVAEAVDEGTLEMEGALYREFVEAARERASRRDAAGQTSD